MTRNQTVLVVLLAALSKPLAYISARIWEVSRFGTKFFYLTAIPAVLFLGACSSEAAAVQPTVVQEAKYDASESDAITLSTEGNESIGNPGDVSSGSELENRVVKVDAAADTPTVAPTNTIAPTNTAVPTSTKLPPTEVPPTPTNTPEPTPELYNASITICNDNNGNGICEDTDPRLEGVSLMGEEGLACTSDEAGICRLNHLGEGVHRFDVDSPKEHKFVLISNHYSNELNKVGVRVKIEGPDAQFDLALGEGRFTLPFPHDSEYSVGSWYDKISDRVEINKVGNWMGVEDYAYANTGGFSSLASVIDEHRAIDYLFKEAVPVLAADAGEIIFMGPDSGPGEYIIELETPHGIIMNMGHVIPNEDLKVGDRFTRGDVIGNAAKRPIPMPNFDEYPYILHIGFYEKDQPDGNYGYLDPYDPNLWVESYDPLEHQ